MMIMKQMDERILELEAKVRESALSELSALGQASDAYAAQLAAEAKVERAAAALRLCLKYNTAMHSGAAEHNKKIRAVLEELERKS